MIGYWILFGAIAVISYLVQANLKNKFERYSKIPTENGMTGREIALKMLHDNGIYDVQVTHTPGMLTDHYNPMNKTVNLSEGVYATVWLPLRWLPMNADTPCSMPAPMLRCGCVRHWFPSCSSRQASCLGFCSSACSPFRCLRD